MPNTETKLEHWEFCLQLIKIFFVHPQEAQQSSMMDLEIADYERTMQTLNEQITERDLVITECRAETARQEENVAALQKQLGE